MGLPAAMVGSVIMGGGITTMRFTQHGRNAVPAMCHFSSALVSLSVVLAIVISLVALCLTFSSPQRREREVATEITQARR